MKHTFQIGDKVIFEHNGETRPGFYMGWYGCGCMKINPFDDNTECWWRVPWDRVKPFCEIETHDSIKG